MDSDSPPLSAPTDEERNSVCLTGSDESNALVAVDKGPRYWVNVEPVFFLVAVSVGVLSALQPLFLYWARCVEIFEATNSTTVTDFVNATDFCEALTSRNDTGYQDIVEKDIASAKIYLQFASGIPTLLTAPLIGAWSDGKGGRRKPLLISLNGLLAYCALHLIAALTYFQWNAYYSIFAAEVSFGLVGGFSTVSTSMHAIVTDDSRHILALGTSNIPARIIAANSVFACGILLGNWLVSLCTMLTQASAIIHSRGYIYAAILAVLFAIIALLYTLFAVKETHNVGNSDVIDNDSEDSETKSVRSGSVKSIKAFLYDLVEVIVVSRPGWTRLCLHLSALAVFADYIAYDSQLIFLFVRRNPIHWSDQTFIYFNLSRFCIATFGMMTLPALISKLNILGKDSILVMAGIAAASAQLFTISFARSTTQIFLATIGSFFVGALAPGFRSLLPRMVAKEETARLFTALGLLMVVFPICSVFTLNNLYNLTIDSWPGFVFLACAVFQLIVLSAQILVYFVMRRRWPADYVNRSKLLSTSSSSNGLSPDISNGAAETSGATEFEASAVDSDEMFNNSSQMLFN